MAEIIHGATRHSEQTPPRLVNMESIQVGNFYVFTNGSGELFIEPIGSPEQYRCAVKQNKLHVQAHTVEFAPYGVNCSGFLLSGK